MPALELERRRVLRGAATLVDIQAKLEAVAGVVTRAEAGGASIVSLPWSLLMGYLSDGDRAGSQGLALDIRRFDLADDDPIDLLPHVLNLAFDGVG